MRVLLVEDDRMIGEVIRSALRDVSYAADWVQDGQTAVDVLKTQSYDIMLLDLGLPLKDGLDVLAQIRRNANTIPVIVITARDALDNRVIGLDHGADDYLVKPFAMAELLARMRAVMRRKSGIAVSTMSNGELLLDPAHRSVKRADGSEQQLSNREYALLHALMLRPGAILSRGELEEKIYGWGEEVESNAIEFLIHGLRKKLGSTAIKNVRGVGWMVSRTP